MKHDIAAVLITLDKNSCRKIKKERNRKIIEYGRNLKKRVIGQDEAIEKITHAIQMHRAGLN